jgi:hypothetical protein
MQVMDLLQFSQLFAKFELPDEALHSNFGHRALLFLLVDTLH